MFETGAPQPPAHAPLVQSGQHPEDQVVVIAVPGAGHDATSVVLPGPTPGTTTYRLRATETAQDG